MENATAWHHNRRYENRCAVEGCKRPHRSMTYCQMHYHRVRRLGHVGVVGPIERGRYHDSNGYIVVRNAEGKKVLEHRVVMEQVLGRQLHSWENIHHRNGIRDDNRAENLELWVTRQPTGQRVADVIAWMVEHYRDEVEAALGSEV